MMNSANVLNKPLVSNWWPFLGIVVSLLGFADATYLTVLHFQGRTPNCTVVQGCEQVLTSEFSTLLSIPVALFGAIYYLAIFIGLAAYLDGKNQLLLKIVSLATSIGLLASLYFFHLQLIVLKAWCQFCILSIITSTVLFIIGFIIFQKLLPREIIESNQ